MNLILTPEIQSKYDFNNNTFITKEKEFETEIGDIKQPNFEPQIKIKRWDNEVNASFRLIDTSSDIPIISIKGNKIKWVKDKIEVYFYDLGFGEGGSYEFEVVLKEKPSTNVLKFSIQTKELDFFYQPPLTEEVVPPKGGSVTETEVKDKDGKRITYRPEKIVGSYGVFHKTQTGDFTAREGKNYKVGKAFHIYRPKIIDFTGNWVWGKLNVDIQTSILSVTIPQDFLNTAIYPIRHAAGLNFGYESIGGSNASISASEMYGSTFTSPSDVNTGDSITFYVASGLLGGDAKGVLVTHSDDFIITNGVGGSVSVSTTPGWWTSTFGTNPSLVGSTAYEIMFIHADAFGQDFYFDAGDTNQGHFDQTNNYTVPQNPTFSGHNNNKYSIYVTYTPTAGGSNIKTVATIAIASVKTISGIAIASVKTRNTISNV